MGPPGSRIDHGPGEPEPDAHPPAVGPQVTAGIARAARIADGWTVARPGWRRRRRLSGELVRGDRERAGVTHAAMRVSWPGRPRADLLATLELLGREVLPEVRRRTGGAVAAISA